MRRLEAGQFLNAGGVAGAAGLTAMAVLALGQLGQTSAKALPDKLEAPLPPLVEVAAAKHELRAPGATAEAVVVRYDPGVIAAFSRLARDYPVSAVTSGAQPFSLDRKAQAPVLAAVTVLPPRRPVEFTALSLVQPPAPAAAAAPQPEQEPRILTIPVPGLKLARHAAARTGEALSATASGAASIVGRGVDAGLGLLGR